MAGAGGEAWYPIAPLSDAAAAISLGAVLRCASSRGGWPDTAATSAAAAAEAEPADCVFANIGADAQTCGGLTAGTAAVGAAAAAAAAAAGAGCGNGGATASYRAPRSLLVSSCRTVRVIISVSISRRTYTSLTPLR